MLVQQFLENSAARLPNKVALICDGKRLTYSEINQQADQLAVALTSLGIKRQDRVVIFMDNSAESVISLFGILKAGAIFIMVNATMKTKKLNYILKDSGARALITHANKARIIYEALDGASALEHVLWVGSIPKLQANGSASIRFNEWGDVLSAVSDQRSAIFVLCFPLHSSPSEGRGRAFGISINRDSLLGHTP
jgi:acyl-CoA synthetase (AMP-forming)/AMP-acid ligase II